MNTLIAFSRCAGERDGVCMSAIRWASGCYKKNGFFHHKRSIS
jgi:hypothetical protein